MIEITFLVFFILLLIRPMAKERGESVQKWSFLTIGAWVGAEAIFLIVLYLLRRRGLQLQQNLVTTLAIMVALYATAAAAAILVLYALRKKPLTPKPVAPTEQLS